MIVIDYKDKRPIYEQVVERMKELMIRGILKPDDQLPSVRSLAIDLAINPNTIQRAYMELERQGYVYSIKGKGNFVADTGALFSDRRKELGEKMEEIIKEAGMLGMDVEEIRELFLNILSSRNVTVITGTKEDGV